MYFLYINDNNNEKAQYQTILENLFIIQKNPEIILFPFIFITVLK